MDAVVIESVSKAFPQRPGVFGWRRQSSTRALADVCLRVPEGSVQVLLGPNGSGKTTLLKLISTMLLPDSGRLTICGYDTRRDGKLVRAAVGFALASERSFFLRLNARENLEFFAALEEVSRRQRSSRIQEIVECTGLTDYVHKMVMTYSAGMYQRLAIARALLKHPAVLLLDEPSRSLDPISAARLWRLIRELSCRGTTVVVATHSLQEAVAAGDKVSVLRRGSLTGQCSIDADTTAKSLQQFYFESVGELSDEFDLALEPDEHDHALAG